MLRSPIKTILILMSIASGFSAEEPNGKKTSSGWISSRLWFSVRLSVRQTPGSVSASIAYIIK